MKQKTLARWLKGIIFGMGVCGLVVYFLLIPHIGKAMAEEIPEFQNRYRPWLLFLWITAVPCYGVLILAWKIAARIGKDLSFTVQNAVYLKWISILAAGDTLFFFLGNVVLLILNLSHPSVVMASLIVAFFGAAVTVSSAVLSHLVLKASSLQEQSDYTI